MPQRHFFFGPEATVIEANVVTPRSHSDHSGQACLDDHSCSTVLELDSKSVALLAELVHLPCELVLLPCQKSRALLLQDLPRRRELAPCNRLAYLGLQELEHALGDFTTIFSTSSPFLALLR